MTRHLVALVLLAACRSEPEPASVPEPAPKPAIDAGVTPQSIDAMVVPSLPVAPLSCNGDERGKGYFRVHIDPQTLLGDIEHLTTGPAPWRSIRVKAVLAGSATLLLFDRYNKGDHTTIKGAVVPRSPREKLVKGKTIVAQIVARPDGVRRMFVNGGVDFETGTNLLVERDGSTLCRAE